MTCDFQQCGILTSVDSDEPVQPAFKLRNSVSSLTLIESGCPLVREKSGKFVFFLQGQGKVREFCKMVREIRKSSKVREKSGNFKIILG